MAGKGSEVGRSFEEIREIIDAFEGQVTIEQSERSNNSRSLLDTCHVWDGVMTFVNDLDGVLSAFDKIIGLDRLKAISQTDSIECLRGAQDG